MHLVLKDGEVWDSPRVLGSFKNSEDRRIACLVPMAVIVISFRLKHQNPLMLQKASFGPVPVYLEIKLQICREGGLSKQSQRWKDTCELQLTLVWASAFQFFAVPDRSRGVLLAGKGIFRPEDVPVKEEGVSRVAFGILKKLGRARRQIRIPADFFHGQISWLLHQRNQSTSGAKKFASHTGSSTQNLVFFLRLRQGQSWKLSFARASSRSNFSEEADMMEAESRQWAS